MAAAVFHVIITLTVSVAGKAQLFSSSLNTHGIGVSFAVDSVAYWDEASKMAHLIQQGQLRQWANYRTTMVTGTPFHLRLYSISLAVFGPLFGYTIFAVEPLNLAFYLLMVFLTYRIGVSVFSWPVGQLAAIVVGVWPSLLLHTMQLMRDPLFICSFLLLVSSLLVAMRPELSNRQAIVNGAGAVAALCFLLLSKMNFWEIVVATLIVWLCLCLVQAKLRKWHTARILVVTAVIISAYVLPKTISHFNLSSAAVTRPVTKSATDSKPWNSFVDRLISLRRGFIRRYPHAGSNVDTNVELQGVKDVVKYSLRAVEIGFLAPFPAMWFRRGVEVGTAGRLIAGMEMCVVYVCLALVGITLVHDRKRSDVWFLCAITAVGCVALGYVVVNIGALYRMRYPYFIPLIILAMRGFEVVQGRVRRVGLEST